MAYVITRCQLIS